MSGAFVLLILVLVLYSTSLLVIRFAEGELAILKQPITWFYASWILGLVILALPFYEYQERATGEVIAYICGALGSFSFGAIAATFIGKFGVTRVPSTAVEEGNSVFLEAGRLRFLMQVLLILGLVGTLLLIANTILSGSLSVAERLNSDNAAQIRTDFMNQGESRIGLLHGPATLFSGLGGLGVALVVYFLGRDKNSIDKRLRVLMYGVFAVNFLGSYVAFGSRMFAIFALIVAFLSYCFGCWASNKKVFVYKLTARRTIYIGFSGFALLALMWLSATYFLEKRVGGQSPTTLLYKTHRATFSKPLYEVIRNDQASQYLAFSASYFSTPIATLAFYLDLPADRYPGPFFGQYNFPPIARWIRRAAFIPDPLFWDAARFEIFRPLGDINFGTNVWATALRDIIADFGKIGSLIFVAFVGACAQYLVGKQRQKPTAVRSAFLVFLSIFIIFSGFVSTLFMPQVHWPLYVAFALLFTRFNIPLVKRRLIGRFQAQNMRRY